MTRSFDDRAGWFDAHYSTTRGRVRLALLLERVKELITPQPTTILDAGGGSGVVAVPLAEQGHRVTLLDPSREMLRLAERRAREAGVEIDLVHGSIDQAPQLAPGPFDLICCHAVLMYVDEPRTSLETLRSLVSTGASLSLLEKNRMALALRPGLAGDFGEAIRVLDSPVAAGNLGIVNRSHSIEEWDEMLASSGWRRDSVVGIRLFSDTADEQLAPGRFEELLELERAAGRIPSYRSVARLVHFQGAAVEID
jgi:SAM-dependent methyltransferase